MAKLLYKTSEDTPPPFNHVEYFERSCDPFDKRKIMDALSGTKKKSEVPESGWMGIDYGENPICFIPDGTGFSLPIPEFELAKGYFKDGRMFAYPVSDFTAELKERHAKYRAEKSADDSENSHMVKS